MYLLDTNVVSALRRLDRADPNLVAWAEAIPSSQVFLSAISVLEIELGVLLVERRDARQGLVLRTWLEDHVMGRFEGRIIAVDTAVARCCARLHVPDPRSERDAMIAACAIVHGMAVATRNVADFEPTGVTLINPWDAAGNSA
ncbi:MAG: type toxin-antitoxin system VapC family toxin [Caulobacter sp.]|nr:type toxin-antitoxin system VapC family toxin [Caulobacter sp.]